MTVLAQCWFTREHKPGHIDKPRGGGAYESSCRYCGRGISSWNREYWHLSDGFNIEDITRTIQERFLYLVDTSEEFVIARFTVSHLQDEEEIAGYRKHLEEKHCSGDAAEGLEIRDSKDDAPRGDKSAKGRRGSATARAGRRA